MYLMIRNKGVANPLGLTLLGASTTRYNKLEGQIGNFGSGSKNSIALLLRRKHNPIIITDTLKMEFYTDPVTVDGASFNRVYVRMGGKKQNLGFVTEFGIADWTKLSMAYREFVANAIDGSILSGQKPTDVEFEVVEKPRAKAGHTSVYLPYTEQIEEAHSRLNQVFLHFRYPQFLKEKLIPKRDSDDVCFVYKSGVLAYKSDRKSVFDYNLGDELKLDESRNSDKWSTEAACGRAIRNAGVEKLKTIIQKVQADGTLFEDHISSSYISNDEYSSDEIKKSRSERFQQAFNELYPGSVICTSLSTIGHVEAKGYKAIVFSNTWSQILDSYGIKKDTDILEAHEIKKMKEFPVTEEIQKAFEWCWNLLTSMQMENQQVKPNLKCFRPLCDGNEQLFGLCDLDTETVWVHVDSTGHMLKKTMLEEMVHWCSKQADMTRGLQDYLFKLITLMGS